MDIKREVIEILVGDADIDTDLISTDYSGRAMYGKTCFAFTGSSSDLLSFGVQLGRWIADEDAHDSPHSFDIDDFLVDVRTDSLGMQTIYYFPRVQVVD